MTGAGVTAIRVGRPESLDLQQPDATSTRVRFDCFKHGAADTRAMCGAVDDSQVDLCDVRKVPASQADADNSAVAVSYRPRLLVPRGFDVLSVRTGLTEPLRDGAEQPLDVRGDGIVEVRGPFGVVHSVSLQGQSSTSS